MKGKKSKEGGRENEWTSDAALSGGDAKKFRQSSYAGHRKSSGIEINRKKSLLVHRSGK